MYSSSPVRTSTETGPTNYQTQSYHQPSNKINNTMYDGNMPLRRGPGGYSNSTASLAATPSRKYPNNYDTSANDINRYQTTAYPSSYRPRGNDNETFRPHYAGGNGRAYSYDDLLHEQNRSQSLISNSRGNYQYGQQHQIRHDQYDDDDDLIVKSTDLSARNEQEIVELVRMAFGKYQIGNQRELAGFLKQGADKRFSACWHCIVGRQFSSYVTHEMNGFIYLTKGPLSILLFKSGL
jgi:hypothetical protein